MTLYYPLWTNVTNPVIFIQWVNSMVGGWFGTAVVGGFFCILFLSMKNYDAEKAFASAAFSSAVLSFLFYLLGIVDVQIVMIFTVLAIASVFVLRNSAGSM